MYVYILFLYFSLSISAQPATIKDMPLCLQLVEYFLYSGRKYIEYFLHVFKYGLPCSSDGKESACNARDLVWSLGQEDPFKMEVATHSSILAWRIPWTEESGGPQSMCHKQLDMAMWLTHIIKYKKQVGMGAPNIAFHLRCIKCGYL